MNWSFYTTEGTLVREGTSSSISEFINENWKTLWKRNKSPPILLYQTPSKHVQMFGYKARKTFNLGAIQFLMTNEIDMDEPSLRRKLKGDILIVRQTGESDMTTIPLTHLVRQQSDKDENTDLLDLLDREGIEDESSLPPPTSFAHIRNIVRKKLFALIDDPEKVKDIEVSIIHQTIRQSVTHNLSARTWKDPVIRHAYETIFTKVYRNLLPESHPDSVKNPKLLELVKNGTIAANQLGLMSPAELWPEKWRHIEEARIMKQIATLETTTEAATDMFECRKCKQRKCVYTEVQTRSADEPMTTFVFCLVCGNRWKE